MDSDEVLIVGGKRATDAVDHDASRFLPTGLIEDIGGFHPGGIEFALDIIAKKGAPEDRQTPVDLVTLESLQSAPAQQ